MDGGEAAVNGGRSPHAKTQGSKTDSCMRYDVVQPLKRERKTLNAAPGLRVLRAPNKRLIPGIGAGTLNMSTILLAAECAVAFGCSISMILL